MATNNLEITLVNSAARMGSSQTPPLSRSTPSPVKQMNSSSNNKLPIQRRTTQPVVNNGRYPPKCEPVSPYTPRKPNQQHFRPVIPNVPSLKQLNNIGYSRMSGQERLAEDVRKSMEHQQVKKKKHFDYAFKGDCC